MNFIWQFFIVCSLIMLLFTAPDTAVSSLLSGGEKAVMLCTSLWAIYAVWLGVLKIVEDTGLSNKLCRLLTPLINKLVGNTDTETKHQIALNISGNLLGLGNAATPSGIAAMEGLAKGQDKITAAMAMLFILNTASLQLVPATIITLMAAAGGTQPSRIIIPCLLTSLVSVVSGIILVKVFSNLKLKPRKSK